jgi:hypothetical protein
MTHKRTRAFFSLRYFGPTKEMARQQQDIEIVGVLLPIDEFGRICISISNRVANPERPGRERADDSWGRLIRCVPRVSGQRLPYRAAPDGGGLRGECWVTVPKARREHVQALARELCGREVVLRVRPRVFRIPGGAAGTALNLVLLTPHE